MQFAKCNKKILLDLLQGQVPNQVLQMTDERDSLQRPIVDEELLLVWYNKPAKSSYLPDVICTPKGKSKEMLAWASTYLRSYRPFTAFTRIIELPELEVLLKRKQRDFSPGVESALVGIILGELVEQQTCGLLRHQNLLAVRTTLSYALARAHIQCFSQIDTITDLYEEARNLAKAPIPLGQLRAMRGIWQHVLQFLSDSTVQNKRFYYDPMVEALQSVANGLDISKPILENILRQPLDSTLIPSSRDKVEIRVRRFEEFLSEVSDRKEIDPQLVSFAVAALANQIMPGSFRHTSLLVNSSKQFTGVFLWYGFCAGLASSSGVLTYNSGLGARVSRELFSGYELIRHPGVDIAFSELRLLLSTDNPDTTFNTEFATSLSVELAPGILTILPWPPKGERFAEKTPDQGMRQTSLWDETFKTNLIELGEKLYAMLEVYKKLVEEKGLTDQDKKRNRGRSRKQR